jgi:hypothetical protein
LPIDFRVFSDGTLVDLIRDPIDLQPRLLIWKNGKTAIQDDVRHADCSFAAPDIDPSLMGAMRLPTTISRNATPQDLLQETEKCISTYIDLQPHYASGLQLCPVYVVSRSFDGGALSLDHRSL